MITALAALRISLTAVVNPNRPILVTASLNKALSPAASVSAMFNLWTARAKTQTVCNCLQFTAKPLPLFSSTYSLFFRAFTPDFLCFHQLPALFCKTGGQGVSMAKFFQLKPRPPERKRAPHRLGGGDPGLGGDCEDWALRSSLRLSVASSIPSPPTRRLRCPCRREGNGATTQPPNFSELYLRRARRFAAALRK
jgi:hypothetical protein